MFLRKLRVSYIRQREAAEHDAIPAPNATASGPVTPCPVAWIDNFAMRNFTNSAVFDDTLPVGDGQMEAGLRVPLVELEQAMSDWFRRKGYLRAGDRLVVVMDGLKRDEPES